MSTLPPGTEAFVTVTFDGTNVRFTFGIPAGADGLTGPPGEVTNAALAAAISGTSINTNGVATLDTVPSDPSTVADYEALRAKLNEFILVARR